LGIAGEKAAGITGPKTGVIINGRMRFPDALDRVSGTLTEVKNVKSLSFTRQLRDYASFSEANGLRMTLYTRQSTVLSGPLKSAIKSGQINHLYIPR
jgi:hypothetical protein